MSMMKHLLIVCSMASVLCMGLVAAQAGATPNASSQPPPYSHPTGGERLADAPGHFQFCTRYCWQQYSVCKQQQPKTGSSCDEQYATCKATC